VRVRALGRRVRRVTHTWPAVRRTAPRHRWPHGRDRRRSKSSITSSPTTAT
jgi:hypothetical protein